MELDGIIMRPVVFSAAGEPDLLSLVTAVGRDLTMKRKSHQHSTIVPFISVVVKVFAIKRGGGVVRFSFNPYPGRLGYILPRSV